MRLSPPHHVSVAAFDAILAAPAPPLVLAPMQDVTDLPFWRIIARRGGADLYFTEYFRVHSTSTPEKWIVEAIEQNPTGRPVVAQMIGNDPEALVRTAHLLQKMPVAGIDLNLGCPAPVVYRKCAGGGLLREPERIDRILGALRDAVHIKFTVKTRIGFDVPMMDRLLPIFQKHSLDLLTVHGRLVTEMYRGGIHESQVAMAAAAMPCPVIANGNVACAESAASTLRLTGARGLMIGRAAIRNPWIFDQIRASQRGEPVRLPSGREVLEYVTELYATTSSPEATELQQVQMMKRYMNFLGAGVDADGQFLHRIRRAPDRAEFFAICRDFLDHNEPMAMVPLVPEK